MLLVPQLSEQLSFSETCSPHEASSPRDAPHNMNRTLSVSAAPRNVHKHSSSPNPIEYKPFSAMQLMIYDIVLWFWSVIFDCFFREIRPRGAFRLPKTGPVIFVAAPHANQFVDPVILMNQVKRESGRRISFLIAMKSYLSSIIGPLSRIQLSIPVSRAQDMLVPATGKIRIDVASDPLRVHGIDTRFTSECTERGLLALPESLGASEIAQIISDTELVIRKEFKSSEKVTQLLSRGTSYKIADKIDQKSVYKYVFEHLSNGHCLGIFPEGGSHDRTDMLPLKAGVAIMALGAISNDPNCNVKVVPCGMNYFNAHKFRSRAVIEFGHPIEIPKELVQKYNNPLTNRESVKELLDIISTGLHSVTVSCQDYETLMVVQAARRLYAGNFAQYLPLPLIVEMNRRLVLGYEHFKDRPEIQQLKSKILRYNEFLKHLRLPDHHVEDCDEKHRVQMGLVFAQRLAKLIFFVLLAFPGAVLFSPVFMISKWISMRKARSALAASTVKIKANDVIATWKILMSLVVAPILYSFYAALGTWYCRRHEKFTSFNSIALYLFLYMLGVLVTYSALVTGEQGVDLFKSIRPSYLSIFSNSSIVELKELRKELSEEITELVNTYGPELFPNDFNLLHLKDHLRVKDTVDYVDSDAEDDRKTQELRNRRISQRKARKSLRAKANKDFDADAAAVPLTTPTTPSDSEFSLHSSLSMSDGVSLLNSDNSYTNIPLFSDYSLHKNAKNPSIDINAFNSTVSMGEDYGYGSSEASFPTGVSSRDSSQIELNFGKRSSSGNGPEGSGVKQATLSKKIRDTMRKRRENDN